LSPSQVSAEIYGRDDLWQKLLVPFNPAELAGKKGDEWLMMGTELRVDPSMLVPQYALIFHVAVRVQEQQAEKEGTPYLQTTGDRVAVVGNTVTYFIQWPPGIWPDINLQWWVEYAATAVEAGLVDKTEDGPSGLVSTEGPSKSHDTTFNFKPSIVGTHTVHCRITYGNTVQDLSYLQTVITLEQRTQIELARGFDYGVSSPKDIVDQLRKELADTPNTPAYKEKRDALNKRINDIEQSLKDAGKQAGRMDPILATYISSADKPLRLPLRLFIGWDPEYDPGVDPDYNLKLWDYTLQGQPFVITARAGRIMPAIEALLNTFAEKCYYPKGVIVAQISASRLTFSLVHDETLTLPTSGPKLIDEILRLLPPDVLRALSLGFLGLAVVSGLLGQEEVAIPAFEVSIYLSGAAAAGELAEKLEHGQFKADVGTALQVADLAAALIGLGAEFEAATTIKGVGRASLTPALSGLGKGIGYAQIGIITGVHTAEIAAAIRSKDTNQVISAILRALGDAAFFFIVHKASAGLGAKGLPEGQPEFVPHEQLKAMWADEAAAAYGHDVVVTEDGRVFRCSENCADLIWAFRRILDERPGLLNELKDIAKKPKAKRIPAAKELLQRLEGLQHIRNLSNEELANRIAQARGSNVETELKLERLRREGVELSADEILEASDINARRSPGGKGVPDPFESGNFAHAMYEKLDGLIGGARVTSDTLPPGVIKEYTIPDNRLPFDKRPRIDRLHRGGETIYEIKPTTQKAKGDAQAKTYAELMDRFDPLPGGRKWKYQTITYDEARVIEFLKDKGVLQKKSAGPNTKPRPEAFSNIHEVLRSSGQPLDALTRTFFEPRFGRDFSHVRVHTGTEAAESARRVQANAYTVGEHLVFDAGHYAPGTDEGQKLLAHELTHVLQQSRAPQRVQRFGSSTDLWSTDVDVGENPTPQEMYKAFVGKDIDQASEKLARKLHEYVLKHPNPYKFILDLFELISSSYEDNVAAAFVALLTDLELNQFAASEQGRAALDMLYEAMITGDVSGFERWQAARIEQFGLANARKRQGVPEWVAAVDVNITPQSMVDLLVEEASAGNLDSASEILGRRLRAQIDRRPDPYGFLRAVFKALPSSYEDNVAADFVVLLDNNRLNQFASTDEGRAVLDILYDAMITGDVSSFERYESERIMQANATRTPLSQYEAYQQSRRIFPVKYQKFLRNCYAPLSAELLHDEERKGWYVKAWYNSVRVYECDQFRKDINTLGVPDSQLLRGIVMKPDDIVSVRLYDEDEKVLDIPATGLIDYANESKNRSLALGEQAFMLGLTLPLGGLPEAGLARGLAIADRVAWGIAFVTSLINDNREWIADLPGGKEFLEAVDSVNRLAGYYGWARMGYDALHLAGSKLRPAWQSWRSAPLPELSAARTQVVQQIDREVVSTLNSIEQAEGTGALHSMEGRTAEPGAPAEGPHESEAKTSTGKEPAAAPVAKEPAEPSLAEVAEASDIPAADLEKEVRELIETPGNVAEGTGQNDAQTEAEGHTFERDKDTRTWCRESKRKCRLNLGHELNEKTDWKLVEKKAIAENREYWKGKETATTFARHKQKFTQLAKTLRNKIDSLAKTYLGDVLPTLDESVLAMPVDRFIADRGSAQLQAMARDLENNPNFIREFGGGGAGGPGAGFVGNRETDIVEFFLDRREVVVTDITLKVLDPVHQFKSIFYKEVLQEMLGENISVFALDINPAAEPIATQAIHDQPAPVSFPP
jgi:hypothetical protein